LCSCLFSWTNQKGKDGKIWKVAETINGIRRWVPVKKKQSSIITPKDVTVKGKYSQFLQGIKISPKPAEMVIYDTPSIPSPIFQKVLRVIQEHGGKPSQQNIYSQGTRPFTFSSMSQANHVMDIFDSHTQVFPSPLNIDISYLP